MHGELQPETNIWRKGLVYTRRAPGDSGPYRISASFKCGAGPSTAGFGWLYHRVRTLATRAGSGRVCAETGRSPESVVACHGWRRFGDADFFAAAFIKLEFHCSADATPGEPTPTPEALLIPGGAALDDLTRLSPQSADELYTEFDFTDGSKSGTPSITLSYGESISAAQPVEFEPIVQRAERMAESYHAFLKDQGEIRSDSFRITRREWFLANQDFATVLIFFAA